MPALKRASPYAWRRGQARYAYALEFAPAKPQRTVGWEELYGGTQMSDQSVEGGRCLMQEIVGSSTPLLTGSGEVAALGMVSLNFGGEQRLRLQQSSICSGFLFQLCKTCQLQSKLHSISPNTFFHASTNCLKRWSYARDYYIRPKGKPGSGPAGEAEKKRSKSLIFGWYSDIPENHNHKCCWR
ncbi:hypothetical protein NPIL_61051 [Nephila pilipes]|uniref:Uncharacterized protein n=1 Tax=Nephila pilipes TaxID=299642 RepID=A0A8X6TK07_NEPPI|nr:hypothetical protein NPIL_61051 [Nephila pilipes]